MPLCILAKLKGLKLNLVTASRLPRQPCHQQENEIEHKNLPNGIRLSLVAGGLVSLTRKTACAFRPFDPEHARKPPDHRVEECFWRRHSRRLVRGYYAPTRP